VIISTQYTGKWPVASSSKANPGFLTATQCNSLLTHLGEVCSEIWHWVADEIWRKKRLNWASSLVCVVKFNLLSLWRIIFKCDRIWQNTQNMCQKKTAQATSLFYFPNLPCWPLPRHFGLVPRCQLFKILHEKIGDWPQTPSSLGSLWIQLQLHAPLNCEELHVPSCANKLIVIVIASSILKSYCLVDLWW